MSGRVTGSLGSLSLARLSEGVSVYFLPSRVMWNLAQIWKKAELAPQVAMWRLPSEAS